MTGDRLDAGDVARELAGARFESLVERLLPEGVHDGGLWRCGSLAGEAGHSLVVNLRHPRRGKWHEFNGGQGGDALDLVAQADGSGCRGDLGEAFKWALDWLGIERLSPEERERGIAEARQAAAARARQAEAERKHRQQDARRIWLAGTPLRPGDLVWRYLQGRGIDLGHLPLLPGALRTHAELWHAKSRKHWPAMVAAIADNAGNTVAVQRTWLEVQSDSKVKKAPLGPDAKMSLGSFRECGGSIHLTRGASGKPWGKANAGETVGFAEGLEDALSFGCARPDIRCAALASSLAYLAHVALPPGCGRVIIIAQNDPPGAAAVRAARNGIAALRAKVPTSVFRPPVFVKDINDWLGWLGSQAAEMPAEDA